MEISLNERHGSAETPEQRLEALGITLPPMGVPIANYVPFVHHGDLVYLSGQGPRKADGSRHTGKVGGDVTAQEAQAHARLACINLIAALKSAVGELSRVKRVVKVFGMVNAIHDFSGHAEVINGCSDLLVEVFGDAGRHARSAIGQGSLPNNITVEIEAIVAVSGVPEATGART